MSYVPSDVTDAFTRSVIEGCVWLDPAVLYSKAAGRSLLMGLFLGAMLAEADPRFASRLVKAQRDRSASMGMPDVFDDADAVLAAAIQAQRDADAVEEGAETLDTPV